MFIKMTEPDDDDDDDDDGSNDHHHHHQQQHQIFDLFFQDPNVAMLMLPGSSHLEGLARILYPSSRLRG